MSDPFPDLEGDSGAAFLARTPASQSRIVEHRDGTVTIRKGAPYISVVLSGNPPIDSLRLVAWKVVQEALDIHAATWNEPLATRSCERQYLLWKMHDAGYRLIVGSTIDMPWNISANATAGLSAVPITGHPPITHHPAFRFYRLSRISDDLFDAFRNAYLCLECIVSDESRKGQGESEINWLKRVLSGPLADGVRPGTNIGQTVDTLYKLGRCPLFHAKSGKYFYTPHGGDSEVLQEMFLQINKLLRSLFRHKFGQPFPAAWAQILQRAKDAMAGTVLRIDEVLYDDGEKRQSCLVQISLKDQPRRFGNLWGSLKTPSPVGLQHINSIEVRMAGQEYGTMTLEEALPITNVSCVSIELSFVIENIRAPRRSHSM